MTTVVTNENINHGTELTDAGIPENAACLLGSSGTQGLDDFPKDAQTVLLTALTIAADGGKADIAKPMHGLGSGVFEIALAFRGDALRVVYTVQLADQV